MVDKINGGIIGSSSFGNIEITNIEKFHSLLRINLSAGQKKQMPF